MLWAEGRAKSHGQLERARAVNPGVEAAGDRPPGNERAGRAVPGLSPEDPGRADGCFGHITLPFIPQTFAEPLLSIPGTIPGIEDTAGNKT